MRRLNRGASLLVVVMVVGGILLITTVGIATGRTCTKTCASVACTETAPCTVNGTIYTAGSVCAPGIAGTVCEDKWWPFADCLCADAIGLGNLPRPICFK